MEESTINLCGVIQDAFNEKDIDIKTYSPLTLAYIGDSVYEVIVRSHVVMKGNMPVSKLNGISSNLAKAPTQAKFIELLQEEFTAEEKTVLKRGSNSKPNTKAKNATMSEYLAATGFEAVIGYLYLTGNMERIIDLVKIGFKKLGEIE